MNSNNKIEKEKCLILLKPDCVRKKIIGKVIEMIESLGLDIIDIKMVLPTKELISNHYPNDKKWVESLGLKKIQRFKTDNINCDTDAYDLGLKVREHLVEKLQKKPFIAMIIEGYNSIHALRKLAGNTEPLLAEVGSIRGKFSADSYVIADSYDRSVENVIHVSDSVESANREIKIWFPEKD
jgi:nucleoside-diphosphate kinase